MFFSLSQSPRPQWHTNKNKHISAFLGLAQYSISLKFSENPEYEMLSPGSREREKERIIKSISTCTNASSMSYRVPCYCCLGKHIQITTVTVCETNPSENCSKESTCSPHLPLLQCSHLTSHNLLQYIT